MAGISTHLKKLKNINKGDDPRTVASSERITAMQELIKSLLKGDHIISDRNRVRKRSYDGLTGISVNPPTTVRSTRGPFEILLEDQFQFRVTPGTMNNVIPENIFELYPYNIDSTTYAVLHVFTDGYVPTRIMVEPWTEPPTPPTWLVNTAPLEFYVILGMIHLGVVFQVVTTNLNALPVDVIHTLAETPQPGRPYYDINYSWEVGTT